MIQRFQDLSFNKNAVNIANRPNIFSFDNLDGVFLASLVMLGQEHVSKASFPQFLTDLVLPEAAAGVEILSLGRVEHGFMLDVLEVVLEILSAIGVEKSDRIEAQLLFYIDKR